MGTYTPDVYVRADGTATSVAAANDPSGASSAYSLATLEADKANTAGLVVAFSSQGGNFTDVAASLTVDACVDCQAGSTYTNVAGESVVFDIQDDAGTEPQIFRCENETGVTIDENTTGTISLTGSGTGKCIEFTGAGTNTIGTLTIVSNHTSANNDCDDGISSRNTVVLTVGAVTVNDCIATSALTTIAQAFTAHDTSSMTVTGATVNNASQIFALAGGACSITATDITGTDWESDICALNGSETVVINDSTFTNDGSQRAAASGGLFLGADAVTTATCTYNNCSITISANGKTTEWDGGTYNLNDTDLTIGTGTSVRTNWGSGATNAATLNWNGGTYTANSNTILPLVAYEDALFTIERVRFDNSASTSAGTLMSFINAAAQGTRTIKSCIFEYPHTGGAIFQFLTNSVDYDLNVQQCTFYSRGVVNNVPAAASGVAFDNCTFNGDGSNIVFETDDPFTYDYCHFRDVTNEPTSTNEVGAGADPGFVTPGSDYNITDASPLYLAGKDIAVTTDFAGNTFNDLTPSVGAYEYFAPTVSTGFSRDLAGSLSRSLSSNLARQI